MSLARRCATSRRPLTRDRYDQVAQAARRVIRGYSTSFGLASRLLASRARPHPQPLRARPPRRRDRRRPARGSGLGRAQRVARTAGAGRRRMRRVTGYSANLVVHAFAADRAGLRYRRRAGRAVLRLDARRPDRARARRGRASSATCYGSAEVVGLMCLRVVPGRGLGRRPREATTTSSRRAPAARRRLPEGRTSCATWRPTTSSSAASYFPGIDPPALTEADKHRLLDDIDADLAAAAAAVPAAAARAAAGPSPSRMRCSPSWPSGCARPRPR